MTPDPGYPFEPYREALYKLYAAAGCPSYRKMADGSGREIAHSTIATFLRGTAGAMPWAPGLVEYLGGDVGQMHEVYKACKEAQVRARVGLPPRGADRDDGTTALEYTQAACDVWQLAHLSNRMAGHGWAVVAVVPSIPGVQVPLTHCNEDGRTVEARLPYEVLFSRRQPDEEEV